MILLGDLKHTRNNKGSSFEVAFPLTPSGTKILVLAWNHASEAVKQQIDQLIGFTSSRLACYETNLRQPLSLADGIVVHHAFGLGFATKFVGDVDSWVYPGEQTKAAIGVKAYVQSTLDKAHASNSEFDKFTEESKTSHLLSPFLLRPKLRPALVRKSRAKAAAVPAQTLIHAALGILPHTVFEGASSVSFPLRSF